MPKLRYSESTREQIIDDIGFEPGALQDNQLNSDQRTALKAYCSRYTDLSREEIQGPISIMRSAYDATKAAWLSEQPHKEEEKPLTATKAPVPATTNGNANGSRSALETAILDLAGQSLNEERVQALIDSALAGFEIPEPRTVEKTIIINGAERSEVSGHVHPAFERVCKLIGLRSEDNPSNIFLSGPAGCGKTHLAAQAAEAMGLGFGAISCSEGMSESKLMGWLLPIGEAGKFEYVGSPFIDCYENGKVFLIDEIDACDANTLTVLNQALGNGGFYLPQRFGNPYVKRHKDFVCIAAANTFGNGADNMYVGRNQLDHATLDRFVCGMTPMDYDRKLEADLVSLEIINWSEGIRSGIKSNRLRRSMSTRSMIGFDIQRKAGFSWDEINASYFAGWSEDEIGKVK